MVDQTLILSNKEQEGLLGRQEALDEVEDALLQYGKGEAKVHPQRNIYVPKSGGEGDRYYWFVEKDGAVPDQGVMGVRMDSSTMEIKEKRGNPRMTFPDPFAGLVLLFDIETNHLLAILQDYLLNPTRVTATNVVMMDHLARENSEVMGVFGSGAMASSQVLLSCEVRDFHTVKIYSTHQKRRESFAQRMDSMTDDSVDVIAVDDAKDAVTESDVVAACTSSGDPVFDGEWLEPGTHVSTLAASDEYFPRRETDDTTIRRSDIIVVNDKDTIERHKQQELYPFIRRGEIREDDIYDVGEIVNKKIHGRGGSQQITYHNNNAAIGLPYAVLGKIVYKRAKQKGLGTAVDADLFMQSNEELVEIRNGGFLPRRDEYEHEEESDD